MKYCYILLLLFAGCGSHEAKPTDYLSIWLLANQADVQAALNGQADVRKVILEPQAILADHDFTAYNPKTGEFFIKAEAAKRLAHTLSPPDFPDPRVHGGLGLGYVFDHADTPFVLKAMSERIYFGVFSSGVSSGTYGSPVVKAADMFLPENSTNDVGLRAENRLRRSRRTRACRR
jgi:hypothetical protein